MKEFYEKSIRVRNLLGRNEESRSGFGVMNMNMNFIEKKVEGRGGLIQNLFSILGYAWAKSYLHACLSSSFHLGVLGPPTVKRYKGIGRVKID